MFNVRKDAPARLHSTTNDEVPLSDIEFEIVERSRNLLVFEMKNTNAAIANALRRIMMAEVETVAVDEVGIKTNTSIIMDEVLAHRVGLLPFKIDPLKLDEEDTIIFDLQAVCAKGHIEDGRVYAKHFKYVPFGSTGENLKGDDIPQVIGKNILLAKLLPGQEIHLRALLRRGIGKDHAKWSPVATASYRIMPKVEINQVAARPFKEQLVAACPKGVFDIEDTGNLVAKHPKKCTMCRECVRQEGWDEAVSLLRVSDHFIFTVESVGMLTPEEIFLRALNVLKTKAVSLLQQARSDLEES